MASFFVAPAKLTKYLLAIHADAIPEAKGKSKFFHGIGYQHQSPDQLSDALCCHPTTAQLVKTTINDHGERRVYECNMPVAPNGKIYCIRTVWQQHADGNFRLATAFPFGKASPAV